MHLWSLRPPKPQNPLRRAPKLIPVLVSSFFPLLTKLSRATSVPFGESPTQCLRHQRYLFGYKHPLFHAAICRKLGVQGRKCNVAILTSCPNAVLYALCLAPMEQELSFRIILEEPPAGVDYGLQKGGGNDYEVVQKQRSKTGDLKFEFSVRVKEGKDGQPVLLGPFTHGPADGRFAYLDIGTYAGQTDTEWSRRLKIPFRDITWDMVKK